MIQQATAPPASAPAATPAIPATRATPDPAAALRENVPRLLNRLQVLAVIACIAFGVVAALVQVLSLQANGRAADNTEQVVRVQKIQSSLLRADALATNAFLVGGLEPAGQRAEYDKAIDRVSRLIADAAEAQPADRTVLAELNTSVTTYADRVTQARDNNRQGFPVGAAYLNLAGGGLRADTLPLVKALVDANSNRAVDEMNGQHPVWLLVLGLIGLAVLFLVNRMLARRFHRRYNLGLVVAGAIVVVLALTTALHASAKNGDNDDARNGAYRTAVDEASGRTAANDAKARESQGLINRGSGATYEDFFEAASNIVDKTASPHTLGLWKIYLGLHHRIRAQDDKGNWDAAVAMAIDPSHDAATAALDEVDLSAQRVIDKSADDAADSFRAGGALTVLLILLSLLGALSAAGAATWGLNQRRREYA